MTTAELTEKMDMSLDAIIKRAQVSQSTRRPRRASAAPKLARAPTISGVAVSGRKVSSPHTAALLLLVISSAWPTHGPSCNHTCNQSGATTSYIATIQHNRHQRLQSVHL